MDLLIRNARLYDRPGEPLDIGIERGRIAAIERNTAADAAAYNAKRTASNARCRPTTCSIRRRLTATARCCASPTCTPTSSSSTARPSCASASSCSPAARRNCSISRTMASRSAIRPMSSIINAQSPEQAVMEIAHPVAAFKNGRQTLRWELPELLRPH